jgi:quinol monooxygenase YgiN
MHLPAASDAQVKSDGLRRAALTADQVANRRQHACAKLRVMAVLAIAEMFGISGRRTELATLLERFGNWAGGEPGCRRYIFAATLTDPSRFVLVSEWETQEALDAHYRSEAFADFQLSLDGLLARPSESTTYSAEGSVRPLNTRPMDPRDAD